MKNKRVIREKKHNKTISFRLPETMYQDYERYCVEEHIFMAEFLRKVIDEKVKEKLELLNKGNSL